MAGKRPKLLTVYNCPLFIVNSNHRAIHLIFCFSNVNIPSVQIKRSYRRIADPKLRLGNVFINGDLLCRRNAISITLKMPQNGHRRTFYK